MANQQQIMEWFRHADSNGSGRICCSELCQALTKGGFRFEEEAAVKMIKMYDRSGNNVLDYNEFCHLYQFLQTMSGAFKFLDRDGSGLLNGPEVRQALANSGYQLSEPVFQAMMRRFDTAKKGGLEFDNYIEMSVFIGTVRSTYAYYDQQRRNEVLFNFDSFLGAAVTMS